jgi:hypothetical protein
LRRRLYHRSKIYRPRTFSSGRNRQEFWFRQH